jgi:type I restriction enzyme R subunit
MADRPSIPADIKREVLIESAHRCAVCGTPVPLELAHIVPWHTSKEHKAQDLLCLCANCHGRADKEKWGERMLREYKERPWVYRKEPNTASMSQDTSEIIITVDMKVPDCDEDYIVSLRLRLAAPLDIRPEAIQIKSTRKGSVEIRIQLPADSAEKL